MNKYLRFDYPLLLCALLGACTSSSACEQASGIDSFKNMNWPQAFQELESCEAESGVSAEALGVLAVLYASLDSLDSYGHIDGPEGARHAYELFVRAAKMGHLDSLGMLQSFYSDGLDTLDIKPNATVADCLSTLFEDESSQSVYLSARVDECLSMH